MWEDDDMSPADNHKEYLHQYDLNLQDQLIFLSEEEFIGIIKKTPQLESSGSRQNLQLLHKKYTQLTSYTVQDIQANLLIQ